MISIKQLNESNAIATLGAQFLTTTAFGMFAGALISTLTGISTKGNNNAQTPNTPTVSPAGTTPAAGGLPQAGTGADSGGDQHL
jgi:hypothetical protein